jgi:hypothetical protein
LKCPYCVLTKFSVGSITIVTGQTTSTEQQIVNLLLCIVYMFLTLILIAFFPLNAAEQNEINPTNEEKLSER